MNPQEILTRIIEHRQISHDEMLSIMRQLMSGNFSPIIISAILSGLRVRGENIVEIVAAAQVMREFVTRVEISDRSYLVDTCGTGGDAKNTFNISTASAFVAAAAGASVAKHGGGSVSSKSGSADVLEILGVNLNQTPQQVTQAISKIGVGFMFAPNFHSAMKYAMPVRQELGVRTLFNILGPLTNPAEAKNQVLGVFDSKLVEMLTHALQQLGSRHAMVVCGQDGLDEITITGETKIGELRHGKITEYFIRPENFGMQISAIETIQVMNRIQSKNMLLSVLENKPGPPLDVVLLNAGAAIYVSGVVKSFEQGLEEARIAIKSGKAMQKLQELVDFTNK